MTNSLYVIILLTNNIGRNNMFQPTTTVIFLALILVQRLLSSRLLSKNLKIKIHKTIILSVVLYGCEVWYLTIKEECRLRAFEKRILRRIFGSKREMDESGDSFAMRNFKVCTVHLI